MKEYMKRMSESGVTMKSRDMEEDTQLCSSKKRKCYSELDNGNFSVVELPENSVPPSPVTSSGSAGCGKYDEWSIDAVEGIVGSPDLENVDSQYEGLETEISSFVDGAFRESTPTREPCGGDSEQVLAMNQFSTSTKKKSSPPRAVSRRKVPASVLAADMPPAAELEDFFAAAEKYEQQRFTEKYNYDIVKDVPLEGKYQWVRLHL